TAVERIDIAGKVSGQRAFIHDLTRPNMLHGRVVRPPSPSATLDHEGNAGAAVCVVRDGDFLGVVAEREEEAVAAAERLRASSTWSKAETLPDEDDLVEFLKGGRRHTTVLEQRGDGGAQVCSVTMRACYSRPFIAHASIAPSCAVAEWTGDRLEIWSHTQ